MRSAENDVAAVSHVDMTDTSNHALSQSSDGTTSINSASSKNIEFKIAGSQKAVLSSNGSLGLGITPTAGLHVKSAGDTMKIEGENNSAYAVYVAGGDTSGVALTGYLNDTGAHQKVLQLKTEKIQQTIIITYYLNQKM